MSQLRALPPLPEPELSGEERRAALDRIAALTRRTPRPVTTLRPFRRHT